MYEYNVFVRWDNILEIIICLLYSLAYSDEAQDERADKEEVPCSSQSNNQPRQNVAPSTSKLDDPSK